MRRKVLSLVLALCMVLSLMPMTAFAAPGSTFDDVSDHWGKDAIERWAGYGVVNGDGTGNFAPDKQMTRAEFATMLANMMGYTAKASNSFADVNDSDWFADAILKLAAAGVIQGSNGMANPNAPITRQESAVLMCRAFNIPTTGGNLDFSDSADVADWAKGAVAALSSRGMMNGVGGNNVAPLANINRASVATLLNNMITEYVTEDKTITGEVKGIVLVAGDANVTVENATLAENLIVAPKADGAEVTLTGSTTAKDVYVDASAAVKVDSNATAGAVQVGAANSTVDVAGKADTVAVDSAATDTKVNVAKDATVSTVDVAGANAAVTVDGKVDNVTVASTATGTDITANSGATVGKVETSAKDVTVSGNGKVENVTANNGTVSVTTPGTTVENKTDSADNVTNNGKPVEPSTGGETPNPNPPSSGGSSGGGNGGNQPGETKDYKIKYELDGGTNPADAPSGFNAGDEVTLPTPTKTGYTFDGWYLKADDGTETKCESIDTNGYNLADMTLWAKWTINKYTVTLNANGGTDGTTTEITNVAYNTAVGALPTTGDAAPSRANWTLLGWATTAAATEPNVTADTVITDDTTFYAVWALEDGAFAINYKYIAVDGDTKTDVTDSVVVTNTYQDSGKTDVTLSGTVTVVGYTFTAGDVYEDETCTTKATQITASEVTNSAVTLYVKLTEKTNYGITYDVDGKGDAPTDSNTYKYTGEVTLATAPTVDGYTFKGWAISKDAEVLTGPTAKVADLIGSTDKASITLYAIWEVKSYTVTLNANEGTIATGKNVTSYTYGVGATLPVTADMTKDGFVFAGWFEENDFSGTAVTEITTSDTGDKTYYAKWDAVYSVTLTANGGAITDGKDVTAYVSGKAVTLPTGTDITKTGYTFAGWFADAQFTGDAVTEIAAGATGDKVFYAKWEPITYTVTFNLNGGNTSGTAPEDVADVKYDATVTLPPLTDITRSGFEAKGWATKNDAAETDILVSTDDAPLKNLTTTNGATVTLFVVWVAEQVAPV